MSSKVFNQDQDYLIIPSTKFVSNSCYSFAVRRNSPQNRIEVYLPPFTHIRPDLKAWLDKNLFTQHAKNPQLYTTKLHGAREHAVNKLIKAAEKNGAFKIKYGTEVKELEDKAIAAYQTKDKSQIVNRVAESVNSIVEAKMRDVVKQFEEKLAEQTVSQTDIAEKDLRIERLEAELRQSNQRAERLKSELRQSNQRTEKLKSELEKSQEEKKNIKAECEQVGALLEHQSDEMFQYESIFEGQSLDISPFETDDSKTKAEVKTEPGEESIYHLNSPFEKGENEITSAEEYCDEDLNKKIQPYFNDDMDNMLDNIEIPKTIFNSSLNAIDSETVVKLNQK